MFALAHCDDVRGLDSEGCKLSGTLLLRLCPGYTCMNQEVCLLEDTHRLFHSVLGRADIDKRGIGMLPG